jgi:hypothetical protein
MRSPILNPLFLYFLVSVIPIATANGAETGRPAPVVPGNRSGSPDTLSQAEKERNAALREERAFRRDSLRAEIRAARAVQRAEKLKAWEEQRAVRDQGRRAHNIEVGAVYENTLMKFRREPYQSYTVSEVSGASLLGLSVGYRTHFLSKLGYAAGVKFLGANGMTNSFDNCETGCDEGYMGTVEARLLGGPLGRFLVMPSVGYTMGRYTVGSRDSLFSGRRYAVHCANVGMGLGLYFGANDEIAVMAELGFGFGEPSQTLGILRLAYAFQIPR